MKRDFLRLVAKLWSKTIWQNSVGKKVKKKVTKNRCLREKTAVFLKLDFDLDIFSSDLITTS